MAGPLFQRGFVVVAPRLCIDGLLDLTSWTRDDVLDVPESHSTKEREMILRECNHPVAPARESRASKTLRAVVYGAAVGDALGVPYECMERGHLRMRGHGRWGSARMPAGTFSDDTSLMLATCDSIRACGGVDVDDMRSRFRAWLYEGRVHARRSAPRGRQRHRYCASPGIRLRRRAF